jgi:membrane-associated protease RseP (regulator of RpoE activity)
MGTGHRLAPAARHAVFALAVVLVCTAALAADRAARAETRFVPATEASRAGFRPGVVIAVDPGGPAARAGLQRGDTVLAAGGSGFLSLEELRLRLAALPAGATCTLAVARDTLRFVAVALADSAPRLGATFTTALAGPRSAVIVDEPLTVVAAVSEWQGLTAVAVSVENRGPVPVAFGPDSVTIVDGTGRLAAPMEPREVARHRFGARGRRTPADIPDSVFVEILAGRDPGRDGVSRRQAALDLQRAALRPARVPPGARHAGVLFVPVERLARPVEVRVELDGRTYRFMFSDG